MKQTQQIIYSNGLIPTPGMKDGAPSEDQVKACQVWIRECAKLRKTWNLRQSSYELKHTAEKAVGRYVTNGAFIEAARREGLAFRQSGDGPNAFFKASFPKSI